MISVQLKALKDQKKLTNQQLSDLSGVPIGTINRIMAGQTENPSFQTVCDLVMSMGGSLDELAGIKTALDPTEEERLSRGMVQIYEQTIRDKNKWIHRMFVCCCVLVGFVMAVVAYDLTHPMVGFFQQ